MIVHICTNLNTEIFQKVIKELSLGFDTLVIYPKRKTTPEVYVEGLNVKSIIIGDTFFLKLQPIKALLIFAKIWPLVKEKKIDVFHCHTLMSDGLVGYFLSLVKSVPFIVAVRSSDLLILRRSMVARCIFKFIYFKANKIYTISITLKNKIPYKREDLIVVPNGI